jgi:hypothetical protein
MSKLPQRKTEEQFDAQAELLSKITAICKDYGVVLNPHNHTYEVADERFEGHTGAPARNARTNGTI